MSYTKIFNFIKIKASQGTVSDIYFILMTLDDADIPITRAVDFYLGCVTNKDGLNRLTHYLFSGTQIQRNDCALFFERKNEWKLIKNAYEGGCIDAVQDYSR